VNVHQFATALSYGDAISDEMLEIRSVLREAGFGSEIFVRQFDPRSAGEVRDYRDYERSADPSDVILFHFSIGSPVSRLFTRAPGRKILIYHNITPHEHFVDAHRILARECYKGRLEIKAFVGQADLAVGDSDFNRRELEAVGYKRTGVLPILMNFAKFDGPPDPVTLKLFDNGKTTLLFVGRFIPNKKFEDVVKAFYFYKTHFNPESQLILAGDYRGLERYLSGLQEFILKLGLTDVHLSGHIEFPELLAYYRTADVYLSLSEHEGFGVPLLEAFHVGLPVIGFDAGAVAETMNGGGVVLRKKDFLRTAALVDLLVRDEGLRRRVVEGQKAALVRYSRANVSRTLLRIVEEVGRG
jgi:glycosyltransferase involved in cell wall biosynthesis